MKLWLPISILLSIAFATIFLYAPMEKTQGVVQKIFYIHVSSALTMYVGFFIAFVSSILYLVKRENKYHWRSNSAIEVGYLFCCIVLVTGPTWAKPIWGDYWTWEPRLTSTFILWLIFTGYLLFQGYLKENQKKAPVISSIIAIIAFLDVPLIHFSVRLWRGVHPTVIRNKDGLTSSMTVTLVLTLVSMLCLFAYLFRHRLFLEKLEQQILERQS
ncbi:MAG: cytochrome c biogenesis protein CcsA [Deltaproteobacteria bacterium]|nr:cytochrome c biogenesis protein CcsA [Deltaproteobacteria bacterium]